MEKLCSSRRQHATNVINFEKKKMLSLTKKTKITSRCNIMLHLWKKRYPKQFAKDKNYQKVSHHCYFTGKYRGASHSICNLGFNVPKRNPAVFRNR